MRRSNNLEVCFYENAPKLGGQKATSFCLKQKGNKIMKDKAEKTCKPRGDEKQNEFISRCIKEQMGKGKTQDDAKGMCHDIWRGEKAKQGIFKSFNAVLKMIIERIK